MPSFASWLKKSSANHPSLTQLLLSLSGDGKSIGVRGLSPIHGQN